MKILFLAQYITIDEIRTFRRNRTGYGYMVKDIANSVGLLEQVDLLTISGFTEEMQYDNIHILPKTKLVTLLHVKIKYLLQCRNLFKKYPMPFKRRLQVLLYYASLGYVDFLIRKENYDLVHIHGVGVITFGYEAICDQYKIPYLITLHGLNSFEKYIKMDRSEKQIEKDFLKYAFCLKTNITFISSGIKSIVEQYLAFVDIHNFTVIPNGTRVGIRTGNIDIKKKYNIGKTDFLFVYIGNISRNKNQIQVINSYLLLPDNLRKKVKVLFVGQNNDTELVNLISNNNLSNNLICTGCVPKIDIYNYYIAADATIMSSLSEGFGLSIIEGFVYGKPNVVFADLAAVPDLYDERAMVVVEERTDEALANGMKKVINRSWDSVWITKYAENYSLEKMAERYVDVYHKILTNED